MTTPRATATGLYCELYWGENLSETWSFGPAQPRVLAAPDEAAPLPLYGFALPEEPYLLAEFSPADGAYRVYPAPGMRVERRAGAKQPFTPAQTLPGERPSVLLGAGEVLRLSAGELSLHVHPSVVSKRVQGLRAKDAVMVAAGILAFIGLPVAFLAYGPDPARQVEMTERALAAKREKDAAKREALGVATPAREMTQEELEAEEDGGTTVLLPNRITVE
ncbi:hypothetical protein FGE12_21370 [Aggregicoccus sp. 17bor-14]|uniref:hypothetical protein n=1 Tax=Myxococcaceae TaxID=31 RepID=UPI00129C4F58|nr:MULTISPECIES: hypothetical protein [Myxococcaceae]MBF5044966.1 hypothetical protein [Simulacricoccus sp. 17bor-14]MRI90709.1 hypothetical protein [Aggregicoccus sp. 17bor-14]